MFFLDLGTRYVDYWSFLFFLRAHGGCTHQGATVVQITGLLMLKLWRSAQCRWQSDEKTKDRVEIIGITWTTTN